MGGAAAAVLAVLASTATPRVSSRDGSVQAQAPAGYAAVAAPAGRDADLELRDGRGDALWLRESKATGHELEADAYDELKALELQLGKDCEPGPMRDYDLGGGRSARGVEGVCGGREYGVLISTENGSRLAIALGRFAAARELLAGVSAARLPSAFQVLAAGALPPLAPLPARPFHGKPVLYALAFFALLQGGALAWRAVPRSGLPAPEPPAPGSDFPISIERRHLRSELVFDVKTAAGVCYEAFSDRKAAGVMSLGGALLVLFFIQLAMGAGPRALIETIAFSALAYAFGGLMQRSTPRNLTVVDSEDRRQLTIREEAFSPLDPAGAAFDADGWELFRMRRRRSGRVRTWEIIEPLKAQVFMEFVEKRSYKNWLRPLVGHLGGHLRTEYSLVFRGQEVGALHRRRAVGNKLLLEMSRIDGLDYRLVMAAALFIERVDPDRWHPWPV